MNNNVTPPINPLLLNPQWIQYQKTVNQPQTLMNQPQIQSNNQPKPLMQINSQANRAQSQQNVQSNEIDFTSKIIRLDQQSDEDLIRNYFGETIDDIKFKKSNNNIENILNHLNIEIQTIDYNHGLSSTTTTIINMGNLNSIQNLLPVKPIVESESDVKRKTSTQSQNTENTPKRPPIKIENLLLKPHRDARAHKIVILLRGPSGSGKSFLANLIKQEEEKHVSSSDKPKCLSIDNYFITEQEAGNNKNKVMMKYEYDESMNEAYQKSLIKSFKKLIDDDLFNFILVDMINEKVAPIEEMSSHARLKGYQIYVADLNFVDANTCFNRNVHNRTLEDIQKFKENWETLPDRYLSLDVSFFFNTEEEIEQVEMDDDNAIYESSSPQKTKSDTSYQSNKRVK
ncbi:unnamed protein product, partial [Brachionus calyciflorus]